MNWPSTIFSTCYDQVLQNLEFIQFIRLSVLNYHPEDLFFVLSLCRIWYNMITYAEEKRFIMPDKGRGGRLSLRPRHLPLAPL